VSGPFKPGGAHFEGAIATPTEIWLIPFVQFARHTPRSSSWAFNTRWRELLELGIRQGGLFAQG